MRVVPNSSLSYVRQGAVDGLLPSAPHMERARHLVSRFPEARLREVTLLSWPMKHVDARVWLAVESMQTTGSFKVRGALLAVESMLATAKAARRPLEIIAASAGNHGIGVACAARTLGATATIVVPRDAPRTKVAKIAGYGAVVVEARSTGYDDAEAEAIELARTRDVPFLSPYDDLDVLVGNGSSLAYEILRALGKPPDLVYCPIGGGGLATGLATALAGESTSQAPIVWGVQSEASSAFATSLERGAAVTTLPPATTLAEGLEGGISVRGFARARASLAGAVVVTEEELAQAMTFALRDIGLALEGSAAIALAPLLAPSALLAPHHAQAGDVVVLLTGRNVDPERLARVVC